MFRKNKKGQSTLEYGLLTAAIVAGLLGMQIYMKRSVQGQARENTDSIGEQFAAGNTSVYKKTILSGTTTQIQNVKPGGETTITYTPDTRQENGTEVVDPF